MPDTPKNKRTLRAALAALLLSTATVAAAADQGYPPPPGPYRVEPPYIVVHTPTEGTPGEDTGPGNADTITAEPAASTANPYDASVLFGAPNERPTITETPPPPEPPPFEPAPAFEPTPPAPDFTMDFSRDRQPAPRYAPSPYAGGEPGPGYRGGYYPPAYPPQGGSYPQGYAEPMWQSMEPVPYGDLPAGYEGYSRYPGAYPQPHTPQPNDASGYYAPDEPGYPTYNAPAPGGYQERGLSEETVFRPAG